MQSLLEQVRHLRQQKQYQAAIDLIQSQDFDPLETDFLLELANCEFLLDHWQNSLIHFEAALKLCDRNQWSPVNFYRMGRSAQQTGKDLDAISYYQQAVQHPQGQSAGKTWHQLGQLYEKQNQTNAAIDAYNKAIQGFEAKSQLKELGMSAYYVGRLYQNQKQWPEAESSFLQARHYLASRAELRAEVCYNLGVVSLQKEQAKQAEQYLSESLSIHQHLNNLASKGMTLLKLCQALMLQRRWQEVLRTARQAVEVLEQTQETRALKLAYELMTELLNLMSKPEEAQIFKDKAKTLENSNDKA